MVASMIRRGASISYNNIYSCLLSSHTKPSHHHHHHNILTKQQQWTKLSPSRSCSSSPSIFSSTFSQFGLLNWYLTQLKSRPIITKSITASFIFAASDFTSQMITMPPSVSYDSMRTTRMAVYGLILLGLTQHTWFTLISRFFPKRDMLTTLKKLAMGQGIYGPCMTTVFFSYNAALQGENGGEIVARLKRDLIPTLINGVCYWPICDFVIFKFAPVQLQPLVHNVCAYVWTIYLSYMASLEGAKSE